MEQKITKISYANEITLITLSTLPGGKTVSQDLDRLCSAGHQCGYDLPDSPPGRLGPG